jgi:ribose transport system substrate-binding protein
MFMKMIFVLLFASTAFATSNSVNSAGGKFTIGMSQCNLGEPWRVQMNAEIKKAAALHPEITVVFKDARNDTLTQRAQIEEFVNSGVDLLIVSPKEAAPLTQPIAEAYKKGIPVIVLDRRVLGTDFTQFIGADNKKIGKAAGAWIAQRLSKSPTAKIVELEGLMTSTPAQDRHKGFVDGIQGSPARVVFSTDTQWLEANARKEMDSALARNPKIVYAHNDPAAHGAYLAAKAAGREKDISFVGVDGLPYEGQAYVKQGLLDASFQYPTGGSEAIESALQILHKQSVPKEVTLRSKFFTKENVAKGGEWLN